MKRKQATHPTILQRAREMRNEPTKPEATLWYYLRRKQLNGYRFRRQHPIDRFIVDFYCHELKLIIEVDGGSHGDREEYDSIRTAWLESKGYKVIRFWNNQVMKETDAVIETILKKCNELKSATQTLP